LIFQARFQLLIRIITFNTDYARAGSRGTPEYNQPYYDPNAAGYDTVFKKKTYHEVGHSLGLCDVVRSLQQPGGSVMNTSVDNCANDVCNCNAPH
jgi:predicted Zn-dependent protease